MPALRDKYKLGEKVRLLGRWLLKTAKNRDVGGGENLSEGDHERFRRAVGQLLWLAGDLRYAVTLLASAVRHQV
eukprot:1127634-Amphidinium_carterae.4